MKPTTSNKPLASYQKPTLTYHTSHNKLIQQISIPLTPIKATPNFFYLDLEGDTECQF